MVMVAYRRSTARTAQVWSRFNPHQFLNWWQLLWSRGYASHVTCPTIQWSDYLIGTRVETGSRHVSVMHYFNILSTRDGTVWWNWTTDFPTQRCGHSSTELTLYYYVLNPPRFFKVFAAFVFAMFNFREIEFFRLTSNSGSSSGIESCNSFP